MPRGPCTGSRAARSSDAPSDETLELRDVRGRRHVDDLDVAPPPELTLEGLRARMDGPGGVVERRFAPEAFEHHPHRPFGERVAKQEEMRSPQARRG